MPPLYGRSEDLAALRKLIEKNALVTMVGPAGIGKTRVAEAVAHELRDNFVDGVRLVELAPLADPALVAATVARAVGGWRPRSALGLTILTFERAALIAACGPVPCTASSLAQTAGRRHG